MAAERWLSLPPEERERKAIYASGRRLRSEINEAVQTGLAANGEIGPQALTQVVLSRVNATREELRYGAAYQPGMVLEVSAAQSPIDLPRGQYDILSSDRANGAVQLRDDKGRHDILLPAKLGANGDSQNLQLHKRKELKLYAGDTIRRTANDHQRGLINADRATVVTIGNGAIMVRTSTGIEYKLGKDDPMLERLDLAYALNAHMAQGLTSDNGIAVLDSRERKLLSMRNFMVTITRLRDELTLIVVSRDKLGIGIGRNPGDKSSALEVTERLATAAAQGRELGTGQAQPTHKAPIEEKTKELERVKPFEIGM